MKEIAGGEINQEAGSLVKKPASQVKDAPR